MCGQIKIRFSNIVISSFFLALCIGIYAVGARGETTTIPVIVNVVGDTDPEDIDAAVARANDILGQAGINLDVARVNRGVQYGDGDANLSDAEGNTAETLGEGELYGSWGEGTGLKLTIANDVWTEEPNTTGWARHGHQVGFVEPDANSDNMGRSIAHEFAHLLTLNYDLYDGNDPNRLMWGYHGGGIMLDPNEIEEISGLAKWRGRPKFVPWEPPPRERGRVYDGWDYVVDGRGGILDGLYDQNSTGPGFDRFDPRWGCGDIRTVGMFWDRPLDPSDNVMFRTRVRGHFDIDSFFDVTFKVAINMDSDPDIDAELSMHVYARPPDMKLYGEAFLTNYDAGLINLPLELIVRPDYKFGGPEPILSNHSLECSVPAEHFDPGSDPFHEWACSVESVATFPDAGFDNDHPITDYTEEFKFVVNWNDDPCESSAEPQMGVYEPYGDTGNLGIVASGFPAGSEAKIIMDGEVVGVTTVASNGRVTAWIPEPLDGQNHTCKVVSQVTDPVEPDVTRYTSATAYFKGCAQGAIEGDLDADCDVDLSDLAVLANNWLAGT